MLHPAPYGQTFRLFAVFYHCQELCRKQLHASTCLCTCAGPPVGAITEGALKSKPSLLLQGGCH